jgi:hypothetical protein
LLVERQLVSDSRSNRILGGWTTEELDQETSSAFSSVSGRVALPQYPDGRSGEAAAVANRQVTLRRSVKVI